LKRLLPSHFFISSLTLPDFFLQVFGVEVDLDDWIGRPLNEITAEYYQYFDEWLTTYFGGLKSVTEWEKFFIHLAQKVVELKPINYQAETDEVGKNPEQIGQIDLDLVLVPSTPYIFNVCRLLLQALGGLRNAVPDGQHHIAGMVRLLFGYEIVLNGRTMPPRSFSYDRTHCGYLVDRSLPDMESERSRMSSVLAKISEKATVRIYVPTKINNFETDSEGYSRVRTESQSKTKARVLCDV
jgi:hypothetical protein